MRLPGREGALELYKSEHFELCDTGVLSVHQRPPPTLSQTTMDTSDTPMPPMPNYDDLAKMVEDPLSPTGYAGVLSPRPTLSLSLPVPVL